MRRGWWTIVEVPAFLVALVVALCYALLLALLSVLAELRRK